MSWIAKALETYEKNIALAGKIKEGQEPLLPLAHMTFKAQLEIVIDQDGNFKGAYEIDKSRCSTIIPVTEASGGRSSGIAPHPLNDTLSYIAGDFSQYSSKDCSKKYEAYLEGLRQWAEADYSHPKVRVIYQYVTKGTVTQDLISCNIVTLTNDGMLDQKKIQGADYEKTLVRFRVRDAAHPELNDATWEDETLMQAYSDYYTATQTGERDICYLTGKKAVITNNHPKGTVASNYGAKLISANDKTNFTFKGRFASANEACVVSYEASQKAHAALAWLSRNYGVYIGNQDKRTYIAWTTSGKQVEPFKEQLSLGFGPSEESEKVETFPQFRAKLQKAFQGHVEALMADSKTEEVAIIGLDAATTGRLSVTYYNELLASDLLERIAYWQKSCSWYYINGKTGKTEVRTPYIPEIVRYAFGTEQGNRVEVDEKVLKQQTERLIYCMVEQLSIPRDMIHALYIKASAPQCYANWWNWENVLSTACAVIAKYNYDNRSMDKNEMEENAAEERLEHPSRGVEFEMELNEHCKNEYPQNDRSYIWGKILATLEKMETEALYIKEDTREPNAMRLWSAFVSHPMTTFQVLKEAVNPYRGYLSPAKRYKYEEEIADIEAELNALYEDDRARMQWELNRTLTETYLLGYYDQRRKLRMPKGKSQTEKSNQE